jgi:RNA polymerase sigma-70 factor (ECF subfamily)
MMTAGIKLAVPFDLPLSRAREERLQAGEVAALEALVASHQKGIFALALRLLGDPDEADTATQDCFLRAFRALSACPADEVGQKRWLARITINLCLSRLRSRKWNWWREHLGLDSGPAEREACCLRTPERELLAKETATQLARALDRLSPRQRAVFVLRHYESCSIGEIAGQLSLNVGTVKRHLWRAQENLRAELRDFYGESVSG